jgi:hypothetical protein
MTISYKLARMLYGVAVSRQQRLQVHVARTNGTGLAERVLRLCDYSLLWGC